MLKNKIAPPMTVDETAYQAATGVGNSKINQRGGAMRPRPEFSRQPPGWQPNESQNNGQIKKFQETDQKSTAEKHGGKEGREARQEKPLVRLWALRPDLPAFSP
ncbi:MAG TPA: hypothetical protein VFB27_04435 [Opitutaceae bacterium]|nr:hypothetical protein [Opitutaceae bacterium]